MAIQAQLYSENNLGFGFGFGNPLCGGFQDLTVENGGCGVDFGGFNQFCFNVQQKQQQQQQQAIRQQLQNQQQRNQSLCFENNSNSGFVSTLKNDNSDDNSYGLSMPFSQSLALEVAKQRQEIDYYIRSQNEGLRLVLQEQRKQQLEMLLKKAELKTSTLLRQKDEEIAKARNRAMELEIFLKKLEMESQAWQKIAQENQAMVLSLNNTLEQLKENACYCFNNGAEDAESCCDIEEEEETEGNRAIGIGFGENGAAAAATAEEQRTSNTVMVCKGCNARDSCVLFLPCRHLCSCKTCETFLDSCPVCLTPKKASIEALIF